MAEKEMGSEIFAQNLATVRNLISLRSRSFENQKQSLHQFIQSLHEKPRLGTSSRDPLLRYEFLLRKELILSLLELTFLTISEEEEEKEDIITIQSLLQIAQSLNMVVVDTVGVAPCKTRYPQFTLADIFDTFVSARGRVLCECILATRPLPFSRIKIWFDFNNKLTKAIIGLIIGATSLLDDYTCSKLQSAHSFVHKTFGGKTWQECIRLVSGSHDELCSQVNRRIWQGIGGKLVSSLSVLLSDDELKENIETFNQLILSINDTGASGLYCGISSCFKYVLSQMEIESSTNTAYNAIEDSIHLLHCPLSHSSNVAQTLSISLLPPLKDSLSLLSLHFVPKNKIPKTSNTDEKAHAVAMETDRLRLSRPLLTSVHSSVWSLGNWLTQSIKNSIVTGRLPIVTSLLFIHGPALLKMADELIRGCGRVGVAGISLPRSSSQYWVGQYCKNQYEDLCGCGEWIEYQLSTLCHVFFDQWREKCHQILTTHFPSPSVWKRQRVRGDDSVPSLYVTICKEQLLDPLLEACQCLVDPVTQQYVIQVSLSILLYELRELLIKDGKYKLSSVGVLKLKKDYTHLLSFLTDTSNGLHPSTHALIPHLGVCHDAVVGLGVLASESVEFSTSETSGEDRTCQDHYLQKIGRFLDIVEKGGQHVVLPPRGVALQILKYKSNNFEKTLMAVEYAMFVSDDLNIDTLSDLSTIPSKQLTTNNNNNNNEKLQHSKMHTQLKQYYITL